MNKSIVLSIDSLKSILQEIRVDNRFGGNGRLLIIGGGENQGQTVVFSSLAAMLSGIDSLYIMIPDRISDLVAMRLPWGSVVGLPDMKITHGVVKKILKSIERRHVVVDSVLIGPGLKGMSRNISKLVYHMKKIGLNIILDSGAIYPDVINIVTGSKALIMVKKGEIKFILGLSESNMNRDHLSKSLIKLSKDYLDTYLVKGEEGIEIFSNGSYYIIPNTSRAPFKYGIFHLLSGLAAGLYSLLKDPLKASVVASLIVMKTCENSFENYGLHYTIENILSIMQNTLIRYLKDLENL